MLRLHCKVQNYAWGRLGNNSLVAQIAQTDLKLQVDPNQPYAEYWIGDHVNGPSCVLIDTSDTKQQFVIGDDEFGAKYNNQLVSIDEIIRLDPVRFLGQDYNKRYPLAGNKLAFMLKVLSVKDALSIQAHPNRSVAQKLHLEMPQIYKDPNPKPEIAISLCDDFVACLGFMDEQQIVQNLSENLPELLEKVNSDQQKFVKNLCVYLFQELDSDKSLLKQLIQVLISRCQKNKEPTAHQRLCLDLVQQYGNEDVGIIFTLLMNVLILKKGEWFSIAPDVPHCYIRGELIECMINSDNVVRGGLTPKLKDIQTLLQILPYHLTGNQSISTAIQLTEGLFEYKPEGYEELRVLKLQVNHCRKISIPVLKFLSTLIVIQGSAKLSDGTELEEHSTWYVMPDTELSLIKTSDQDLLVFIANPSSD